MKNNFLLGMPAILLMTMAFTPAFAGAPSPHLAIESADIFENSALVSAKINAVGNIPPLTPAGGAYGTGVLTDGTLVVTTTHPGVLDSATQGGDATNPIQHNHYVNLVPAATQNCLNAGAQFQVASLSFQSPGIAMWPENMYKIWEIPKQSPPGQYTDALSGAQTDFTLGSLTNTGFGDYVVVSFNLVPDLPTTVCVVVEEVFEAEINPLIKVAGELLQIDTTALVVSGISTTAVWMLPIVVSAAGIGAVIIRKKF